MYHYNECSLADIWLTNGYRAIETKYGPATQVEHVEALHRAIRALHDPSPAAFDRIGIPLPADRT